MALPIPPAPLPDGKVVVSACASVLHTCCLTPFSYRQPLHIGKEVLALSPEPLPQKGFLWFSAEVLLHKGTFERLEQRRAPLDAFLLAIDFVNEGSEGILEREWWKWKMKSLSV